MKTTMNNIISHELLKVNKLLNYRWMLIFTFSQHFTGGGSKYNEARKRNKRHNNQKE